VIIFYIKPNKISPIRCAFSTGITGTKTHGNYRTVIEQRLTSSMKYRKKVTGVDYI